MVKEPPSIRHENVVPASVSEKSNCTAPPLGSLGARSIRGAGGGVVSTVRVTLPMVALPTASVAR